MPAFHIVIIYLSVSTFSPFPRSEVLSNYNLKTLSTCLGISEQCEVIKASLYLYLRLYGQINGKRLWAVSEMHLGQIKLTKHIIHILSRFPVVKS